MVGHPIFFLGGKKNPKKQCYFSLQSSLSQLKTTLVTHQLCSFIDESFIISSLNLAQKVQKFNHQQNFINLFAFTGIRFFKKIAKALSLFFLFTVSLYWTLIIDKWLFSKLLFRRKALILEVVGPVFSSSLPRDSDSKTLIVNSCLLSYLVLLLLAAT